MKLFKLKTLLISFFLFFSSCSHFYLTSQYVNHVNRSIASADNARLEYLLSVDRFSYYLGEFTNFQDGKIHESVIEALREIKPETILEHDFPYKKLSDAKNYDTMIHELLKTYHPNVQFNKTELIWNYNFLKNKLNEAYTLAPTRLHEMNVDNEVLRALEPDDVIELSKVFESDMTLDSGHYISNRTSRGVFWEAIEEGRTFEFHLGEARDFVNNVTKNQGEIVAEIKPLAQNYNKIYIVKYPGESKARLAISNIGGMDRLQHLVKHIELSNISGHTLSNKIEVFGTPELIAQRMEADLVQKFNLLGPADRVIIGQKGAIDKTLHTMWKLEGLRNLHDKYPTKITGNTKEINEVLRALENTPSEFDFFKINKSIETVFEIHKNFLEANDNLLPPKLKVADFGNSVADFSDYLFTNIEGKQIRWRVISNMWGDEIEPIARALKATGHKNITYAGTAGAYPNKGYSIGDLVIPDGVYKDNKLYEFRGKTLEVKQYKGGAMVEHVGSPFEETHEWLAKTSKRSDLVEIETSYLGRVFNGQDDHVRIYLLVSDILGSEGETLASATSSKRRNSLNRYIGALFERDKAIRIKPVEIKATSLIQKIKQVVNKAIPRKALSFRHYVISHYLNNSEVPTVDEVLKFEKSVATFTDNSFSKRVGQISHEISKVLNVVGEFQALPTINVDKSFVQGTWNSKSDPLNIVFGVADKNSLTKIEQIIMENTPASHLNIKMSAMMGEVQNSMASYRPSYQNNLDHLVVVYQQAALKKTGLDFGYGATGNFRFQDLPIKESVDPCGVSHCHLAYYAPDSASVKALKEAPEFSITQARKMLNDMIDEVNYEFRRSTYGALKINVKSEIVESLPGGNFAHIVPEFNMKTGELEIVVKITKAAQNNPMVFLEETGHLMQMIDGGFFNHPLYWTEIALNAEHGAKRSQLLLAQAELDVVSRIRHLMGDKASQFENYLNARAAHAQKIITDLKGQIKIENKSRRAIHNSFKTVMAELEQRNLKLDDLIAANDRKGVADLIENFMPWEDLEPVEIKVWRGWIESIRNPAKDVKNGRVYFRGIANDLVREAKGGGQFLMSTMLTKNQGSYTRRLRSLATYHKKLLQHTPFDKSSGLHDAVRSLYVAMEGHSLSPEGSPYLSLSNFKVGSSFGGHYEGHDVHRVAAIRLDERRLMPNIVSSFTGESERLVPLIIFPDELIAIKETQVGDREFVNYVETIVGRKMTPLELTEQSLDGIESMKAWWEQINPRNMTVGGTSKRCQDAIKLFF